MDEQVHRLLLCQYQIILSLVPGCAYGFWKVKVDMHNGQNASALLILRYKLVQQSCYKARRKTIRCVQLG